MCSALSESQQKLFLFVKRGSPSAQDPRGPSTQGCEGGWHLELPRAAGLCWGICCHGADPPICRLPT